MMLLNAIADYVSFPRIQTFIGIGESESEVESEVDLQLGFASAN